LEVIRLLFTKFKIYKKLKQASIIFEQYHAHLIGHENNQTVIKAAEQLIEDICGSR